MVFISLVSVLNLLYFYISTFRSMCAVPNMAVFYSSLTSCFPGMLLTYFLNDFEIVPVTPIISVIIIIIIIIIGGRDSAVGIATLCELDGTGSNSGRAEIFLTRTYRPRGPTSLLYIGCRVSFRVKTAGALYHYTPSGPSWSVTGRNSRLYLHYYYYYYYHHHHHHHVPSFVCGF